MNLINWQLFPLLSLAAYFLYLTYYYAVPMFCLKVLLFYAHIRYRGVEIRFVGEKIALKYDSSGKEHVIVRHLETDPTSRFFAMTVCAEFKGILREIRTGVIPAADDEDGLPAEDRLRSGERQRTEEDCD